MYYIYSCLSENKSFREAVVYRLCAERAVSVNDIQFAAKYCQALGRRKPVTTKLEFLTWQYDQVHFTK